MPLNNVWLLKIQFMEYIALKGFFFKRGGGVRDISFFIFYFLSYNVPHMSCTELFFFFFLAKPGHNLLIFCWSRHTGICANILHVPCVLFYGTWNKMNLTSFKKFPWLIQVFKKVPDFCYIHYWINIDFCKKPNY